MALTATLDKQTYNPGDTMTLTVKTAAGDRDVYTDQPGTVTVDPDAAGPIQPVTVDYVAKVKSATPASVVIADPSRTWTVQSDDGLTLVATSKA